MATMATPAVSSKLAILALLGAALPAMAMPPAARDWLALSKTEEHSAYIERHSWKIDPKKNLAVLLVMDDYRSANLTPSGKKYQSEQNLLAFDCTTKKAAVMAYINYSGPLGEGAIVSSGARELSEADFNDVPPESIVAPLLQLACSKASTL
jgi:hypothetical protein